MCLCQKAVSPARVEARIRIVFGLRAEPATAFVTFAATPDVPASRSAQQHSSAALRLIAMLGRGAYS